MKRKILTIIIIILLIIVGILFLLTNNKDKNDSNKTDNVISTENEEENRNEKVSIDNIQIGDFVNYKVNYSNVGDYHSGQTTNGEMTGWRILNINEDKSITLISAGVPIKYCQNCDEKRINSDLGNLYKVLSTDKTVSNSSYSYFLDSGFDGNTFDMTQVFNTGLEDTSSIHAMSGNELLSIYQKLTGKETTIEELFSSSVTLTNSALKLNEDSRALDLLENGFGYYINAVTNKDVHGNRVLHSQSWGYLTGLEYGENPIRIVLNLKPGIELISGKGTISEPFEIK